MALTKKQLELQRKILLKELKNPKSPYSKKNFYSAYKQVGGKLTYAQATKKRKAC
jgi:hypothetical protein